MSFAVVRRLFESRIKDNWTATSVAYENIPFEPTLGQNFISLHTLFSDGSQISLGDTALNRWLGMFQIDVFVPLNQGTQSGWTMVDTILTLFYHYEEFGLVCKTGYAQSLGQEGEWYRFVVTIPFQYDEEM